MPNKKCLRKLRCRMPLSPPTYIRLLVPQTVVRPSVRRISSRRWLSDLTNKEPLDFGLINRILFMHHCKIFGNNFGEIKSSVIIILLFYGIFLKKL